MLPIALNKEPLLDALFEVRFKESPMLSDLLPGYLFSTLSPKPVLHRLPASEIPQPMRKSDPNLKFSPLVRLDWGDYYIAIGEKVISISCKLPYPKWPKFRETIFEIVRKIIELDLEGSIDRYSVKYVNLLQAKSLDEQSSNIDLKLQLGSINANAQPINLQLHQAEEEILHILSIVIGANVTLEDGSVAFGAIVDIDSIRFCDSLPLDKFNSELIDNLESLRQANKIKFFSCLTENAVKNMEPVYE